MKIILGYFLFVLLAILSKANSSPNCETYFAQFIEYFVPQLCTINLCDAHCTCFHNATYGKCIDYPTDNPNVYVPQPTPAQMCTCIYKTARPQSMPALITRETCLLQYTPTYPILFSAGCPSFCSDDCVCAHGFESGSCVGSYCICNGEDITN